jgi:hypothetical protein
MRHFPTEADPTGNPLFDLKMLFCHQSVSRRPLAMYPILWRGRPDLFRRARGSVRYGRHDISAIPGEDEAFHRLPVRS